MPEPLQLLVFDTFGGTEEGTHTLGVNDVFSPSGSKNVYIDKRGRIRKISGVTAQGAAQATDTGGSTAKWVGLFPYRATSGAITTRQLIGVLDDGVNEWEVWKSLDDGATWTFLFDAGMKSVGVLPDFSQFGSDLFITNGQAPKTWNGTTLTTSGGTQSPQPTAVASGAVGELTGSYKYKIVTRETDGTRSPGSLSSTSLSVSGGQATITWAQDANPEAAGYELYRTTGVGVTFFFLTYIDGAATTAYTDNTSDSTIFSNRTLDEHGDAPEHVYFCEPHKGRMWWFRTGDNPTRGWWSDPGDADSVYAENYLDFEDSDTQGDVVTGALGNFGEQLIVFGEKALWAVSGTGELIGGVLTDWNKDRKTQTGCVSHRSALRVPAGSRYIDSLGNVVQVPTGTIAYFTPLGDIRLFDGDNDVVISTPIQDTLASFSYNARATVHANHDAVRSQLIWWFPSNNTLPNKAVVWNYKWGAWHVWEGVTATASTATESASEAAFVLLGGATGKVLRLFEGNSFDGTDIEARWMTKTIRGVVNIKDDLDPALSYTKRWRWVDLLFRVDAPLTLKVEWFESDADETDDPIFSTLIGSSTITLTTSDGDTILTADGDTIVVNQTKSQVKVRIANPDGTAVHGLGLRLRIGDESSDGAWTIEGMTVAYQLLEGLKRRWQ